jgi:hypothetical protein
MYLISIKVATSSSLFSPSGRRGVIRKIDMQGTANFLFYIRKIRYAAKMKCRQGSANSSTFI